MSSSGVDQAVDRGRGLTVRDPWREAEVTVEAQQCREVDDDVRQPLITEARERRGQQRQPDPVATAGRGDADRTQATSIGRPPLDPEMWRPDGSGLGRVQPRHPDDSLLAIPEQQEVADV